MMEFFQNKDEELLIYLNNLGNKSYYNFWSYITETTTWIPLFLLVAFLLFKTYQKRQAMLVIVYMLFIILVNLALMTTVKFLTQRTRPLNVPEIAESLYIIKERTGYSFYSGHASFSFLFATLSFLLLQKKYPRIIWVILFPVLFCYSRIYFGAHYVSDVIFGALVGITLALIAGRRIIKAIYGQFL